jgi:hypothetical protein
MSIGMAWSSVEEAAARFGLESAVILKWVEEGLVRSETVGKKIVQVNLDDIELKVQELTGI